MSLPVRFLLAALLLFSSGCAKTIPFRATELTPTRPLSAAQLTRERWNSVDGAVLMRQSALFEFAGLRVPVAGLMKLDPASKSARLVGLNDMGVKLYDISVSATASTANFVLPELARYAKFPEAVALSMRRIFLAPEPEPGDKLTRSATSYLLSRDSSACKLRFSFGGADAQLLEKSCRGGAESWRVRYYQYQNYLGRLYPGGIVLDDDRAGYRLTLWIENVEKSDE